MTEFQFRGCNSRCPKFVSIRVHWWLVFLRPLFRVSSNSEMRFCSVQFERLPRFAINRHAAEIPFLWIVRRPKRHAEFIRK